MSKVSECDNNELLNEFARLHRKDALQDVHQTPFTLEDSERCIQVRGELISRMPEHGEDSELRTKLKRFLLELNHDYVHKELQQILDSTDAKDSLAPEGETSAVKPTYEELVKGLSDAIEHLNYCGWGDRWERECAENLRKELPELLKKAQGG
jgi:hypothetical protein